MTDTSNPIVSAEFIRLLLSTTDKFEEKKNQLGLLFANQSVRKIGRLHTWYHGQRAEFDFTKYGVFLYPNSSWDEPVLYTDGMGVDHASGVIGSVVTSMSSSSRDVVRLFRRFVTPKSLWLPATQQQLAQRWDVFGIPRLSAVDNGSEFISYHALFMFLMSTSFLLRIPPGRGDLKGTVERNQGTMETRHISHVPGYVSRLHVGLNPKYSKVRERAKLAAKYTLAEYEAKMFEHAVEFNEERHPRLKKRRIDVYRDGQELAPLILLTDLKQQRLTFALTYEVKLTREGVEVATLKFNSDELALAYLTYSGRVLVKLDPDDVRSVLVILPHSEEPIEAYQTTFTYTGAVNLELYQHLRKKHDAEAIAAGLLPDDLPFAFEEMLEQVQGATKPELQGSVAHKQVQAAGQAAAMPKAQPKAPPPLDLGSLLAGSKFSDDR
jgi:hypothetical protein